MFKKKSAPKSYQRQEQNLQRKFQVSHGIQAKLDSIINSNSRVLLSRQQQARNSYKQQPSAFFSKYSNKNSLDNSKISQKRQSLKNSSKNIVQQPRIPLETKNPSFENQLKGLIKIIYQKQKQIQKLKVGIKQATSKVEHLECKRCMRNQVSPSMEELQSLNINDIKETTGKIMQLQSKQSQLHEIIDFMMKKQQDSNKKIKQLSSINKQLRLQNDQLADKIEKLSQENKSILQSLEQYQQGRKANDNNEVQILRGEIKERDEEILKLNSDILKIVQSGRSNQNQMSQKINLLIQQNHYISNRFKQLEFNLINQLQTNQFTYQKDKLTYQKEVNEAKSKHLQLQSKHQQLQQIIANMKNEIKVLEGKQTQLLREKQGLQKQLTEVKVTVQQKQNTLQSERINQSNTINKQYQTIKKYQSTIKQYQSTIKHYESSVKQYETQNKKQSFSIQALQSQITLLNSRLSQTESQTSSQQQQQYNQLLQQIRLNSTNKTTIEEYKKLLDQIQHQNHLLQLNHQKEIKDYQDNTKSLLNKILHLQAALETQKNQKNNSQKENDNLKLQLQILQQSSLQYQIQKQSQIQNQQQHFTNESEKIKTDYEDQIRILTQQLNLTKQSCQILTNQLNLTKQSLQVTKKELQQVKNRLNEGSDQISVLKDQLQYQQKYSHSIQAQLQQSLKNYQQTNQKLQQTTKQLHQSSFKLIEYQTIIHQLKAQIAQLQERHIQVSKHYQEQSLQIDIQCLKCQQLQIKLKEYQLKLENIQKTQPDQIISFPTIGNLSNIDIANSSFQCKLQDLVQFSSRHFLSHQNQSTPKTLKDIEKKKTTTLLPLQQNSLQQDSSYVRYQDQLIKELQKQCNQPTEVFLGRANDKSKMLELSQIKQSLKMTKQVNFQLFQEINRQQKIITQFKNVIRTFVQMQKQSSSSKGKISTENKQSMFSKLQDLLLIK